MVRGQKGEEQQDGMGAFQLRHTLQQSGEALVVPRTNLAECRRVPAQQRHRWQLPGAGQREQSRTAVDIAEV